MARMMHLAENPPAEDVYRMAHNGDEKARRIFEVMGSALGIAVAMLVNVFNFAYNMVMARMLGPAAFGNINAAVTLLLLASCVSLAFQLVCAKFVARNQAASGKAAVVRNLLGKAWIASLALAAGLFLAQRPIAAYLNVPSPWIIGLLAVGIAAYAPLGVKRGAMQGVCAFPRLGTNFVLEALTRFFLGAGLVVAGYGVLGAVGGISASVIVACFIPRIPAQLRVKAGTAEPPSYAEAVQAIVFFVGQVIINNVDILLVKHFFPSDPAGKGARPVVVVSPDERNRHPRASTVIAVPLTTTQCSARWKCFCSDSFAPGFTVMRLT